MTESEWLSSNDPVAMLRLAAGCVSSCCGCIWCRNYDGTLSLAAGQQCCTKCDNAVPTQGFKPIASVRKLRLFAQRLTRPIIPEETGEGYPSLPCPYLQGFLQGPDATQADLLRCIVGNPFRPVTLPGEFATARGGDPELRRWVCPWITPTVLGIARRIHDERDWDALPILADALEDENCPGEVTCERCNGKTYISSRTPDDSGFGRATVTLDCPTCKGVGRIPNPILAHLRGPSPHARGCWAVDLILGKE